MEDLSGKHIKGYELREKIGYGGMGEVYRAYQPIVDRDVAIKVILSDSANRPDFIRRFEAEAQFVARLEHPHIVPLFDYWREPDGAFLVMRYLRGGSLSDRLQAGAYDFEAAARLFDQLTSALAFAHRQQVLHRDLKPGNILMDDDGQAYLSDFGIAKDLRQTEPGMTDEHALMGTYDYMSPEQMRQQKLSPQSDIFSAGIILYQVLAGQHPLAEFPATERMVKLMEVRLLPLSKIRPDTPPALDEVIQRATARQPQDRFASMTDFGEAIRHAIPDGRRGTGLDITSPAVIPVLLDEATTPGQTDELLNPYKGLRAFQEADAADFFGREALVERLLERLREPSQEGRFLAVVGPSGSGKSSVVKAGLIPALRQGALPGSDNWFVVEMFPGTHPFEELEAALVRLAVNMPTSLLDLLTSDERGLVRALKRVLPGDEDSQLLLLIDQFEELFTLVEDESIRTKFIDSLVTAVEDARGRLRVIVTLRADFYDRPLLYEALGLLMRKRTEVVLPLSSAEMEAAIQQPAQQVGIRFEAGLVGKIVQEVGQQPGTLPLLQYALTELFERRTGRLLTEAAYLASGGVLGALARRADELYLGLDADTQAAARQLFLRLVTLGEGTEDTRRRVQRSELVTEGGAVDRIIDLYGKYRLLTFDRDPVTRGSTIEVAHEALIRTWERLREWIIENRDELRIHRRLTTAAAEWDDAGRDASYLATGLRLAEFEAWSKVTELALNAQERAFIEASLADDERKQTEAKRIARRVQNFQRVATGAGVVVVLAMLGTLFAIFRANDALDQATDAEHRVGVAQQTLQPIPVTLTAVAVVVEDQRLRDESLRLADEARNILDNANGNAELAALLSIRGVNTVRTSQALSQLARANQRLYTTHLLVENQEDVLSVDFSPDGRYALVGGSDDTARLFDVATGAELRVFAGHTADVQSVLFSPDGRTILTGSADRTARLWDVATGNELHVLRGHVANIWALAFSPDGRYALTGSAVASRLWDVATGEAIRTLRGGTDEVWNIRFSPDGRYALAANRDGTARIWDVATGEMVHSLRGSERAVEGVAYSPDGRVVVTSSFDGIARLWNAETGDLLRELHGHTAWVVPVEFSPDGRYLLTGSGDTTARLWNAETGAEVYVLRGHTNDVVCLKFSADGRYAVTGSADGTARVWDIETGALVSIFSGQSDWIWSVAFSSDGHTILTASLDGTARLWDMAGSSLQTFIGHTDWVPAIAFSPDGRYALTGGGDSTVLLWDVATGDTVRSLPGHSDAVEGVAFSPNGQYALTGSRDGTAHLSEVATGALVQTFRASGEIQDVAFSPDGQFMVASLANTNATLWNVATGEQVQTFTGHTAAVDSVAFSPDGRYLLTGSEDTTARLWEVATGETVQTFSGHTGIVRAVGFAPDGQSVLTGSDDSTARRWDVATGATMQTFSGHTAEVWSVEFSTDMRYVLTAGGEGNALLWDVATGATVQVFSGHSDIVSGATFSPDGTQILTSSWDHTARLWAILPYDTVEYACTHVFRDFTDVERQRYRIADGPTCPQFAAEGGESASAS